MGNQDNFQTVMVVEDSEADIDALVACLGQDYRVRVAIDGATALEDIRSDLPDIILLDILMPGIDGFEVCRQIKADPKTRDALIIFVTSLTEAVDETRGLELGAIDYITKPFNFAIIRAKVKTHLELARARKDLVHQNKVLKENIRLREQVEQVYRHDLKTPIQVILGSAQLMLSRHYSTDEGCETLLKEQVNACYTMMDMINRTMLLYKMEEGTCPIDVQQVNIIPVFSRILLGMSNKLQARGIELRIYLNQCLMEPRDTYMLSCDEMLFYVMMSNLIKNAMDASPQKETIMIQILDNEQSDDSIIIKIENRGVVPESIRDCFFEKFVTCGKSGGTGLGTYSARLTAELHGGSIRFSASDQENTTTLSVVLPK